VRLQLSDDLTKPPDDRGWNNSQAPPLLTVTQPSHSTTIRFALLPAICFKRRHRNSLCKIPERCSRTNRLQLVAVSREDHRSPCLFSVPQQFLHQSSVNHPGFIQNQHGLRIQRISIEPALWFLQPLEPAASHRDAPWPPPFAEYFGPAHADNWRIVARRDLRLSCQLLFRRRQTRSADHPISSRLKDLAGDFR
jgi:hypothetical protein